jgi:formyl-CoA transferase
VVDLSIWVQGPLVSAILGDLGAEVIKVEKPGEGDFSRGAQAMFRRPLIMPDGRNLLWNMANRNKKGIAVNLYHARGREVFYRLVQESQVMVTNLHPEALRHMEADRETVLKHNPDLIYAQATGFGQQGPHAEDPCQDTTGMARSGFMFINPTLEGDPLYPPGALSDVMSATMLAFGVVTSLLGRERTGKTPAVTASQVSSMMWLAQFPVALHVNMGMEYPPFDRTDMAPLMNIYRCGDGKWLALGIFLSDRWWHSFCEAMGLPEVEHDPRFAEDRQRARHRRELIDILDRTFATRPRAEWERCFQEKGIVSSIVNRYSDLPSDPQVQANEYLVTWDNGVKGVPLPFELQGLQPRRHGAPEFSQHTEEVLREVCGYSWEEIVALKAEEAVW